MIVVRDEKDKEQHKKELKEAALKTAMSAPIILLGKGGGKKAALKKTLGTNMKSVARSVVNDELSDSVGLVKEKYDNRKTSL